MKAYRIFIQNDKRIGLILTLFFFGSFSGFGQNFNSRFGIKLLPGLTNIYLSNEESYSDRFYPKSARLTFNTGCQYIHRLKDSLLFFETGLYFADRGFFQQQNIGFGWDPTFFDNFRVYNHDYNLSIPILFRIELKYMYVSTGFTVDYFLYNKIKYISTSSGRVIIEKSRLQTKVLSEKIKLGVIVNLGKQIRITDHILFFVEGVFNISNIQKISVNEKYYFHINYLIGTGLSYQF